MIDVVSGLYINQGLKSDINSTNQIRLSHPIYYFNNSLDQQNININQSDILVIAAEGLRDYLAIGPNVPSYISIDGFQSHGFSAKIISMQIKISGFIESSSYYPIAMTAPLLISLDQMRAILNEEFLYQPLLQSQIMASPVYNQTYDMLKKSQLFSKIYLI